MLTLRAASSTRRHLQAAYSYFPYDIAVDIQNPNTVPVASVSFTLFAAAGR